MSSVLLGRGNEHPVWLAGSGEGQPLRGDRLANPLLDGLDRDKRNVIVPEHRAVAAGAISLFSVIRALARSEAMAGPLR